MQIVGTCFTLGDVLPQRDLSCVDVKKDIPAEFKPTSYISEVAVQEGPTRVRVRYALLIFRGLFLSTVVVIFHI